MFCFFDGGLSAFAVFLCFCLADDVVSGEVAALAEFCGRADVVCAFEGLDDLCF